MSESTRAAASCAVLPGCHGRTGVVPSRLPLATRRTVAAWNSRFRTAFLAAAVAVSFGRQAAPAQSRPMPKTPLPLPVATAPDAPAADTAGFDVSAPDLGVSALGLYTPPACTGIFLDVACPGGFAVTWIEQLSRDDITAGCGGGNFCPDSAVTRAQMAVFVEKAIHGTDNWPAHTQLVWAVKNPGGSPNPTASGTALLTAVANIPTTGSDAPSSSNPWLLTIGPGIYDLGSQSLSLPAGAYLAIEGSGEGVTVIQSTYGASQAGTLAMSSGGQFELRNLTVENNSSGSYAIGVSAGSATLAVRHATITVNAGGSATAYGVYASQSVLALDHATVTAQTPGPVYGVYCDTGTQLTVDDSSVNYKVAGSAGWGIYHNSNSGASIRNSDVTASVYGGAAGRSAYGLYIATGSAQVEVWDSHLHGGCYGTGQSGIGLYNASSFTDLRNVHVESDEYVGPSCGSYGIENAPGAWMNIFGSHIFAYGYGIYNTGATGGVIRVNNTKLENAPVYNDTGFYTEIGGGELPSGSQNFGTLKCAGVWDSSFNFSAGPACP